jgi:hypothetical protein
MSVGPPESARATVDSGESILAAMGCSTLGVRTNRRRTCLRVWAPDHRARARPAGRGPDLHGNGEAGAATRRLGAETGAVG